MFHDKILKDGSLQFQLIFPLDISAPSSTPKPTNDAANTTHYTRPTEPTHPIIVILPVRPISNYCNPNKGKPTHDR